MLCDLTSQSKAGSAARKWQCKHCRFSRLGNRSFSKRLKAAKIKLTLRLGNVGKLVCRRCARLTAFSTPVLGLGHVQAFGLSATLALRVSLFQESKKGRLANKSFYNGSEMAMQALPIHSPCEFVFFQSTDGLAACKKGSAVRSFSEMNLMQSH